MDSKGSIFRQGLGNLFIDEGTTDFDKQLINHDTTNENTASRLYEGENDNNDSIEQLSIRPG